MDLGNRAISRARYTYGSSVSQLGVVFCFPQQVDGIGGFFVNVRTGEVETGTY